MIKKIYVLFIINCFALNINAQEKLNINSTKSTIKWIGEYTFYFGGHDGNITFKEGYFIKTKDVITGGEFVIDMNTITNNDIEKSSKANENLVNHLKEPDFFDVKKYPLGTLKITKVAYSNTNEARIEADLTLKGITESINFRAEFDYKEKEMKTRFKIDRKKWNVNYKSKMKDSAISDAIGFEVSIKL
ncbi:MAG: polyisoprenoid-binding protein YceI [Polaribacter sp.]|jgi:polyisoprenoid-binding protein YceI